MPVATFRAGKLLLQMEYLLLAVLNEKDAFGVSALVGIIKRLFNPESNTSLHHRRIFLWQIGGIG